MFSDSTKKFIEQIRRSDPRVFYSNPDAERLQVDSFVSKIASIYEKVRNAIDYKEDHLIRKAAIFRILQRKILIKINSEDVGLSLLKELIRAGYLENNFIYRSKVEEVNEIFEKYLALFNFSGIKRSTDKGNELFKWLLELAACEIEECLMPPLADRAMVEFMFKVMRPNIKLVDKDLSDEEKDLQIYLAAYKALVKSDESMMDLKLLKYMYPAWKGASNTEIMTVGKKIYNLKAAIEKQKKYNLSSKLLQLFKKYTFVFLVLRDIILENPLEAEEIFKDPDELEYHIRQVCQKSYIRVRTKLRRSIVRVTIYLFLTKMLLALVLELPYDYYIAQEIAYTALIINALFPPALIFMLGIFIKIPSGKNTKRVVAVAKEAIYSDAIGEVKGGLGKVVKRSNLALIIFYSLYFILFIFSFGLLIYILDLLHFNIFSKLIFLLFLSLVSFFGIKMRNKITELVVIDRSQNPIFFLVNLFILPFLNAGHWLSEKFSKINVFVFILDFIIEAPFKIFLEVIEDWLAFLREKKDEMYDKSV
ncbi:MAG: hypothetical protein COU22_01525 [Candidatus Komeilibacteria bacterium CG10_big_fil_rev_8_21_14_0_10_41_13]|uniref:Uncharacterized protein n=1 Tax=Candidatus Komeilibacteria bacterium CG10_big_fil_rev_8_21_14_0_10_41_13 TaxID=1974476 RepID=A0A2M6WCM1_9BACT|nr:MAG: hypothetical protein COU22_01525 [Candidatus Komeilibacteria bacterium CG10_big_fil_rev_8_21_14_0_10_41_13]